MCMVTAIGCLACGLVTQNTWLWVSATAVGYGFGTQPAILHQICLTVPKEDVGRIQVPLQCDGFGVQLICSCSHKTVPKFHTQGASYAVMQAASFFGPYVFWYLYSSKVSDDDDDTATHQYNTASSLFWWVAAAMMASCAVVAFVLGETKS